MKCPNCGSEDYNCLTMLDLDKDKAFGCTNCGVEYNPNDTKDTIKIPAWVKISNKDFVWQYQPKNYEFTKQH